MVGGWWLVVGGWWLVVGGWWLAVRVRVPKSLRYLYGVEIRE